uniref:Thioredoxin domain-containing protein 5 n=2 Tax=Cacopsylla melanoneura TaxID=428564 RepID=A0A8D8V2H5_9HEMI
MMGDQTKKTEASETDSTNEIPVKQEPVVSLTSENFNDVTKSGIVFIKFFAPWCGHCKRLAPTWEELGSKLLDNNHGIVIGKVDCTQKLSESLCNQEGVDGFPSLYVYKNGVRISEYNGSRDLEELYQFIIKHKVESHDEL